jgi:tRNA(fMet)-specific endonuclease VapC
MKYLLDTNTCVRHLNRRSPAIIEKLASLPPDEIAVCSVVKAELFYGAQKSEQPIRTFHLQQEFLNQFVSLAFDDRAADIFAQIRAKLEAAGTPIGPYDMQIAAIALVHNLIVITHNVREFGRVVGLQIEDWEV